MVSKRPKEGAKCQGSKPAPGVPLQRQGVLHYGPLPPALAFVGQAAGVCLAVPVRLASRGHFWERPGRARTLLINSAPCCSDCSGLPFDGRGPTPIYAAAKFGPLLWPTSPPGHACALQCRRLLPSPQRRSSQRRRMPLSIYWSKTHLRDWFASISFLKAASPVYGESGINPCLSFHDLLWRPLGRWCALSGSSHPSAGT